MEQFIFFGSIGSDLVSMGKETAQQFGVDWKHFLFQVINFSIVLAVLYLFAFKRVLAMLQERKDRIAESMANAEKIKADLAKAEAQNREILTQANIQATKLIEEARGIAAQVQEQETQKAIAAAEQIITKAREAAAADHARMLGELKREVGRLVVQATTVVTGRVLTREDQRRLVEETAKVVAG